MTVFLKMLDIYFKNYFKFKYHLRTYSQNMTIFAHFCCVLLIFFASHVAQAGLVAVAVWSQNNLHLEDAILDVLGYSRPVFHTSQR